MDRKRIPVTVCVSLKHMSNISKTVQPFPFLLANTPHTVRELIEECVRTCLDAYTQRAQIGNFPQPVSEQAAEQMQEIGKIAFGVHYNTNEVNTEDAIQTALDAFRDGIVRIIKGSEVLHELEEEIEINEGDVFTFVKLTMLSGRLW